MTERWFRRLNLNRNALDLDKIRKGCEFAFKYFDEKGFSLLEVRYLMNSMDLILEDIVKEDPLRKIADFSYSSSVGSAFSRTAASNTKS